MIASYPYLSILKSYIFSTMDFSVTLPLAEKKDENQELVILWFFKGNNSGKMAMDKDSSKRLFSYLNAIQVEMDNLIQCKAEINEPNSVKLTR